MKIGLSLAGAAFFAALLSSIDAQGKWNRPASADLQYIYSPISLCLFIFFFLPLFQPIINPSSHHRDFFFFLKKTWLSLSYGNNRLFVLKMWIKFDGLMCMVCGCSESGIWLPAHWLLFIVLFFYFFCFIPNLLVLLSSLWAHYRHCVLTVLNAFIYCH